MKFLFSLMKIILASTLILLSPMMMISMNNWIMVWILLELGSLSFLSIIMESKSNDKMMIYFLTQSFSSFIFLFFMMNMKMLNTLITLSSSMILLAMSIKLGMIPFHQWMISLGKKINMKNLFLLLVIQKISPLMLISWTLVKFNLICMIILMNSIISPLILFYKSNMKEILMFSSIFQTSWIIFMMMINKMSATKYFLMYLIIMILITSEMKIKKMNYFTDQETKPNLSLSLNFISMAGIPPFTGFLPKMGIMNLIMKEKSMMLMFFMMMMMSLLTTMVYIKAFFPMWMKSKKTQWNGNLLKISSLVNIVPPFLIIAPIFM